MPHSVVRYSATIYCLLINDQLHGEIVGRPHSVRV